MAKMNTAKYRVYKQTTSNACKVQKEDELPHFGEKHLGPFNTKAEATKAMCDDVDNSMSDQNHCWTVTPTNACNSMRGKMKSKRTQPIKKHHRS